jgi:predicted branched-subunit amino acid permease
MQKLPDNFLFGVITAMLGLAINCFLLFSVRHILMNHFGNEGVFAEPKPQLIAVLINIIFFRLVIVNYKKEKTGRGILFTTVMLALVYFFMHSRYHFRMMSTEPNIEMENSNVNA